MSPLIPVAIAGLVLISLSILGLFYRVWRGPSVADRVVALDTIGANVVAFVALYSLAFETDEAIDAVLVIAILAFIGTVAIARYLARGAVIDRKG